MGIENQYGRTSATDRVTGTDKTIMGVASARPPPAVGSAPSNGCRRRSANWRESGRNRKRRSEH